MEFLRRITDMQIFGTGGIAAIKPRDTVRVVLLDDSNRVAVLYIGAEDFYMLPGGGIDAGESPEQALAREVLEETGCRCKVTQELGVVEENSAAHEYREISYCYLAKVVGKNGEPSLTPEEQEEDTRLEWHPLPRAMELIKNQSVSLFDMKFCIQRDISILMAVKNGAV
ncbi:MAG: NUDIX hydrolase [Defluviitaleaceae bacterium]|nr:NUDIX hydrolase [Defluviitaleaceae bacterium]